MTLQQLLDIACRHMTTMADALVLAVLNKARETGETLDYAPVRRYVEQSNELPNDEYEHMVRSNSDTRWNHC